MHITSNISHCPELVALCATRGQLLNGWCWAFQVLDDKNVRRRFRASNYQSTTRVKPFICTMPMRLDDGWNQIQFNLSDFTRRAYGTNYIETLRVQVSSCCVGLKYQLVAVQKVCHVLGGGRIGTV